MVTRNINANTATQVNANLIGVQVRPEVVPPTYEVNEMEASVEMRMISCTNKYNGMPMVYLDNWGIWGYSGTNKVVSGVAYNAWTYIGGDADESPYDTIYTRDGDLIVAGTQFYAYEEVRPDIYGMVDVHNNAAYTLNYSGYAYKTDPAEDFCIGENKYCILQDNFLMMNDGSNLYLGMFAGDDVYTNVDCIGVYDGQNGSWYTWKMFQSINEESVYFNLYSTVRNIYEGYSLYSNPYGTTPYRSAVTSVTEDEVDPGYTEDVDCKVEYSVDGETWTEWPDHMTDDNNVISNIPRYMYLKFSQDVVITEE